MGITVDLTDWMDAITERDPLSLLLADEDGTPSDRARCIAILESVREDAAQRADEVARGYIEIASAVLGHASFDEQTVEQANSFNPGADGHAVLIARERVWWAAMSVADADGSIARALRETYDGILNAYAPATTAMLLAGRRRPRGGMTSDELNVLMGYLTDGMTLRGRIDPLFGPEQQALVTGRLFDLLTEDDPDGLVDDEAEGSAAWLDRELAVRGVTVAGAAPQVLQLLRMAQLDDIALVRARLRCATVLRARELRGTAEGLAAWRLAALTVGVLDPAHEPLVADVASSPGAAGEPLDELARVRALLRLGRPAAAADAASGLAARWRDPSGAALATALAAQARLELDDPGAAQLLADEAVAAGGTAAALAHAVRAHLLHDRGEHEAATAAIELGRAAADAAGADHRPHVALDLAAGTVALATGQATAAADLGRTAGDRLARVLDTHPAGGPWRLLVARARVAEGDAPQARRLVSDTLLALGGAESPAVRTLALLVHARTEQGAAATATREEAAAIADRHGLARLARIARADGWTGAPAPVPATAPAAAAPTVVDLAALGLSPRVAEVVALVAKGMRDAEIADALGIAVRTVNRHVATALKTTGARNRVALTRLVLGQD